MCRDAGLPLTSPFRILAKEHVSCSLPGSHLQWQGHFNGFRDSKTPKPSLVEVKQHTSLKLVDRNITKLAGLKILKHKADYASSLFPPTSSSLDARWHSLWTPPLWLYFLKYIYIHIYLFIFGCVGA